MRHLLRVARAIKEHNLPYSERLWETSLGGYAVGDAEFQRAGVKWHALRSGERVPVWGPDGDEWMAGDAFMNLLGLTREQSELLFGTPEYIAKLEDTSLAEFDFSIDATIERIRSILFPAA